MADKTMRTRIKLTQYTHDQWTTKNPVLLAGEVAVVIVPAATDSVSQTPAVLFKVGDGTSTYTQLKFVSALAGDVHPWAKAESKPTYTASEITGLSEFISGEVDDTDTQYKIKFNGNTITLMSAPKGTSVDTTEGWTLVSEGTITDSALTSRVGTLESLVGETAVATQISNAIAALKLAETYVTKTDFEEFKNKIGTIEDGKTLVGMISENAAAINAHKEAIDSTVATLVGEDTNKSVRTIANEELAAQLLSGEAEADFKTLQQLAQWLENHPEDAAAMNASIEVIQKKLEGIAEGNGTVKKYVDDAIAALNIGNYALAADLTALAGRVTTLETWKDSTATIATTGNVNDLVQTEGDTLILDCSTAFAISE